MSAAALDPRELDSRELAALLDWYVENGVDLALDDAPHDRYADSARAPAPIESAPDAPVTERQRPATPLKAPESPPRALRPAAAPVAPDAAVRAAQEEAAAARDLDDLAERLAGFDHAPFREMARNFLFATGPAEDARLMVFDVAPGEAEEASGEPFCGDQARLLDNMLAAINVDRTKARLAYFSPWRPPGMAALTPQHIAIFAPFARRHVELARPRLLLIFGEAPARALLDMAAPLSQLRGRTHEAVCGAHVAPAFVLPAVEAIYRSPGLKPGAWRDLRRVLPYLD